MELDYHLRKLAHDEGFRIGEEPGMSGEARYWLAIISDPLTKATMLMTLEEVEEFLEGDADRRARWMLPD
jgi:hypothetical protein